MTMVGLIVMERHFEVKNCSAIVQIHDIDGDQRSDWMATAIEQAKVVVFTFNLMDKSLIAIKRWYKL